MVWGHGVESAGRSNNQSPFGVCKIFLLELSVSNNFSGLARDCSNRLNEPPTMTCSFYPFGHCKALTDPVSPRAQQATRSRLLISKQCLLLLLFRWQCSATLSKPPPGFCALSQCRRSHGAAGHTRARSCGLEPLLEPQCLRNDST